MSLWVPCKSASAASPVIKAGSSLGHVSDGDEKPGCILKWQHRHQSLPPVLGPGGFQTASCSLKILHPVGGPITAVSPHPSIHALVEFITSQESPDFWSVAPLNLNLFRYLVYLTISSNPEGKKKKKKKKNPWCFNFALFLMKRVYLTKPDLRDSGWNENSHEA